MENIRGISSGRTSLARSVPTRARTSSPSSKRSARSKDTKLILLDLRDGQTPGEIVADDFSLAWRVFDAQYWGVPQRRKRIYLVADFAGGSAGKILFESEGVSGYTPQGFRPWQGVAGAFAEGAGASGCVCLNDQGGSRIDVTEDVAATLRAENHGHPPCVMGAASFCTEHSAQARGIGYGEETSPTLRAGTVPAAVYENHSQDTRYIGPLETAPTVMSTYGTGGNNQPFVVETPKTLKIRSGCDGGGKGALIQDNKSATLGCNNDQTVFVPFVKGTRPHSPDEGQQWRAADVANTLNTYDVGEARCNELAVRVYGICSKQSHAMLSDNPHSGFYEADTSRCLDRSGGNPTCNQGGMAVVALQGSMIGRADKNGPQGSGVNEDVSFTLDAADRHAVAYCMTTGSYTQTLEEQSPTLMARDYKDPPVVNETEPEYIVRRLTPTECARLQGFPDWWCAGLGTDEPTEEEIEFWTEVFETHRTVLGTSSKPKSRNQIIKWLKGPHPIPQNTKCGATVWRFPMFTSCSPGSCTMHSFRKDNPALILQKNVRKPLAISGVQSDICTTKTKEVFAHGNQIQCDRRQAQGTGKRLSPIPLAPGRNTSSCPPAIMKSTTLRSPRMGHSSLTTAPTARKSSGCWNPSPPLALNVSRRTALSNPLGKKPKKRKKSPTARHRAKLWGLQWRFRSTKRRLATSRSCWKPKEI